jgi:hypothetical protein
MTKALYYVSPRQALDDDPAPEIATATCAQCDRPLFKYSARQRFCSQTQFVVDKRRKAMTLWRAQA